MGVSTERLFSITWAVSGVLGGLPDCWSRDGISLAGYDGVILMKTFTAAIFGGMVSYPGVVIGGLSLGFLRILLYLYFQRSESPLRSFFW
jgi:branched-subunit amino acid ABC-type transport system permease component